MSNVAETQPAQKIESVQNFRTFNIYFIRLHKTQDLLYESTKDFLELRYQGRANERQWMAEKDKLLREMDQCKSQLCTTVKDSTLDTSNMYDNRSSYIEEIKVRTQF